MKHLLGFFLITFTLTVVACDNEDTTEEATTDVVTEETAAGGEEEATAGGEGEATAGGEEEATAGGEEEATAGGEEEATAGGEETEFVVTSTDESEGYLNFTPKDLTVPVGATVKFVMSNTHNAIEVSQETFENRQSTPLDGGFQVQFGETKEVTFYEVGVHYYVCTPHVSMDMVGTITVYNE